MRGMKITPVGNLKIFECPFMNIKQERSSVIIIYNYAVERRAVFLEYEFPKGDQGPGYYICDILNTIMMVLDLDRHSITKERISTLREAAFLLRGLTEHLSKNPDVLMNYSEICTAYESVMELLSELDSIEQVKEPKPVEEEATTTKIKETSKPSISYETYVTNLLHELVPAAILASVRNRTTDDNIAPCFFLQEDNLFSFSIAIDANHIHTRLWPGPQIREAAGYPEGMIISSTPTFDLTNGTYVSFIQLLVKYFKAKGFDAEDICDLFSRIAPKKPPFTTTECKEILNNLNITVLENKVTGNETTTFISKKQPGIARGVCLDSSLNWVYSSDVEEDNWFKSTCVCMAEHKQSSNTELSYSEVVENNLKATLKLVEQEKRRILIDGMLPKLILSSVRSAYATYRGKPIPYFCFHLELSNILSFRISPDGNPFRIMLRINPEVVKVPNYVFSHYVKSWQDGGREIYAILKETILAYCDQNNLDTFMLTTLLQQELAAPVPFSDSLCKEILENLTLTTFENGIMSEFPSAFSSTLKNGDRYTLPFGQKHPRWRICITSDSLKNNQ